MLAAEVVFNEKKTHESLVARRLVLNHRSKLRTHKRHIGLPGRRPSADAVCEHARAPNGDAHAGNSGVTCGVHRTPHRVTHVTNTPLEFHSALRTSRRSQQPARRSEASNSRSRSPQPQAHCAQVGCRVSRLRRDSHIRDLASHRVNSSGRSAAPAPNGPMAGGVFGLRATRAAAW